MQGHAEQLIYTSAGGFRVVAASAGLGGLEPEWLRWLGYDHQSAEKQAVYRVFAASGHGEPWVFARTIDGGTDQWGRPGNYLAHAFCVPASYLEDCRWDLFGVLRSLHFLDRWEATEHRAAAAHLDALDLATVNSESERLERVLAQWPRPPDALALAAETLCARLLAPRPSDRVSLIASVVSKAEARLSLLEVLSASLPCPARSRLSFSTLEIEARGAPFNLACLPYAYRSRGDSRVLVVPESAAGEQPKSAYFRHLLSAWPADAARGIGARAPSLMAEHWLCANTGEVSFDELNLLTEFFSREERARWIVKEWSRLGQLVLRLGATSSEPPGYVDILREMRAAASGHRGAGFGEAFRETVFPSIALVNEVDEVITEVAGWWSAAFERLGSEPDEVANLVTHLTSLATESPQGLTRLLCRMEEIGAGPWLLSTDVPACQDLAMLALRLAAQQGDLSVQDALWAFAMECLAHVAPSQYDSARLAEHLAPLVGTGQAADKVGDSVLLACRRSHRWDVLSEMLARLAALEGTLLAESIAKRVPQPDEAHRLLESLAAVAETSESKTAALTRAHEVLSGLLAEDVIGQITLGFLQRVGDELLLRLAEWPQPARAGREREPAGQIPGWKCAARLESLRRMWASQTGKTALRPIPAAPLQEVEGAPQGLAGALVDGGALEAASTAEVVGFVLQLTRARLVDAQRVPQVVAAARRVLERASDDEAAEAKRLGLRKVQELRLRFAANIGIAHDELAAALGDGVGGLDELLEDIGDPTWPRARNWLRDEERYVWGGRMPRGIRTILDRLCQCAGPSGLGRIAKRITKGKQEGKPQ